MKTQINLSNLTADKCMELIRCAYKSNTSITITRNEDIQSDISKKKGGKNENNEFDIFVENINSSEQVTSLIPIVFNCMKEIKVVTDDSTSIDGNVSTVKKTRRTRQTSNSASNITDKNPVYHTIKQTFHEKVTQMATISSKDDFVDNFLKCLGYEEREHYDALRKLLKSVEGKIIKPSIVFDGISGPQYNILKEELQYISDGNSQIKNEHPKMQNRIFVVYYANCFNEFFGNN